MYTQWAKNSTDIGKINGSGHIKFQIGPTKLLYKLSQYSLKPETKKKGLKPIVAGFISQDLLRLCSSPCNTTILPVKKPNG